MTRNSFCFPRISIVIPIHNGRIFLRACLDAIVKQTYLEWEAVCVNDGSTDSSAAILKEYAEKDARFVVVEQTQSGVTAARRNGVEHCSGDYITFCDCDDFLPPRALEHMIGAISRYDADIVAGNFVFADEKGKTDRTFDDNAAGSVCLLPESEKFPGAFGVWGGLWSHIYRKSLFNTGCSFSVWPDSKIKLGEDFLTNAALLLSAHRVVHYHGIIYCYRNNSLSTYHLCPWGKRTFEDSCNYLKRLDELIAFAEKKADRIYLSYLLLERLFAVPTIGKKFKSQRKLFLQYYLKFFLNFSTNMWILRKHPCAWRGFVTGIRHFI